MSLRGRFLAEAISLLDKIAASLLRIPRNDTTEREYVQNK